MGRRVQAASAVQGRCALGAVMCVGGLLLVSAARAQDPKAIVQQAVNTELQVSRTDHSHWRYNESEMDGSHYVVVETQYGEVKRHIGASEATLRQDDEYNQRFVHDPALQQKQRQAGLHDDKDASELLNEMPEAFVWKLERETADEIALSYHPNPDYRPPDMESRVMGQMAGTMVVSKPGNRIKTFKGRLTTDIEIGWGLVAKIHQGGTFDVERRQIAPGEWAITETHVHISGHALFFKTIGQQEDEVKTDFTPVPAGTTLEQAVEMLTQPASKR